MGQLSNISVCDVGGVVVPLGTLVMLVHDPPIYDGLITLVLVFSVILLYGSNIMTTYLNFQIT